MTKRQRASFHHGNLRTALLESAFRLLDADGADAVTIRAVARDAGVSHAAPINHFPTRQALLTAMATQLFCELHDAIRQALTKAPPRFTDRVKVFTDSLIEYGLTHPHRYRLLWRRDIVDNDNAELQLAMDAIYDDLIAELMAHDDRYDPNTIAVALWSVAHGYVSMRLDGNFVPMNDANTGQPRHHAMIDFMLAGLDQ